MIETFSWDDPPTPKNFKQLLLLFHAGIEDLQEEGQSPKAAGDILGTIQARFTMVSFVSGLGRRVGAFAAAGGEVPDGLSVELIWDKNNRDRALAEEGSFTGIVFYSGAASEVSSPRA